MKCFLGLSNFLEETSSLSHAIVFLYLFALTTEEGFLISPCYSLGFTFRCVYLSFSPFPFTSALSSAICKASSDNHFAFLHFFYFIVKGIKHNDLTYIHHEIITTASLVSKHHLIQITNKK